MKSKWIWRLRADACTGCGICADVCRPAALEMTPDMALPRELPGRCVGCMVCVEECPFDAVVVERKQSPEVEPSRASA